MEQNDSMEPGTASQETEQQTLADLPLIETSPTVEQQHIVNESALAPLFAEMAHLRQDFETKVLYDQSKERIIDSLHKELQHHRADQHFRILRPVLLDLITFYDNLGTFIEKLHTDNTPSHTVQNIIIFQDMIEEMLNRNGVTPFTVEQETFLPSKQRSLRAIATADQTQDRHIARRVRKGFEYESKQLRPEIVEIYKYDNSQSTETTL